MKKQGFTLIELVVVIVILGILAATALPKFLKFNQQPQIAAHKTAAGAFASGIMLARAKLLASGATGPAENFPVYGSTPGESLDFNSNGWPSQHYLGAPEANPSTNNANDCISVWEAILTDNSYGVASDTSEFYQALYIGNNSCRYSVTENSGLSLEYNSLTGDVTVDSIP